MSEFVAYRPPPTDAPALPLCSLKPEISVEIEFGRDVDDVAIYRAVNAQLQGSVARRKAGVHAYGGGS
jgi:hypothetical protein